jgi:hypothetical protein
MSKPSISNVRKTTVRAFSLGIVAGAFITAATFSAIPARADTDSAVYAYAASFGGIVCSTLDEYPSFSGIIGIGEAISTDGLSMHQAGQVIAVSVIEICPRHLALVKAFVNSNTGAAA